MTDLDAYVPMEFRWALTHDTLLPDRAQGAVLFADISGSTSLTAALARELGPRRGAEELTWQLDRLFTVLIAQVHRYRGSVIGFSGDSITCWFDQSINSEQNVAWTATTVALAMQTAIAPFALFTTPAGVNFSLGVKVAVVAGAVRRFVIGDPTIQRFECLAGATMNRLVRAEQEAKRGEVIVGAEVVAQLGSLLRIGEWRQTANGERLAIVTNLAMTVAPSPWPGFSLLPPERTQPWLLPLVYQRLQSGYSDFLAELRPVVAFFLKFSGIDYDQDDEAGGKLDAYIRWVQTVLARFEGYLMHVSIGDKGIYLNAAFGALVAHEDDPLRSLAAALALQISPPELNFIQAVQIGIGQDLGFVGAYGSAERRTYGILGHEINIAARLMNKAAPGEIWVTPRIANTTRHAYELDALPAIMVKGAQDLLAPFLVRGRRGKEERKPQRHQSASEMVGRAAEQAVLDERLRAAPSGQAGVVVIQGEAGIGKSHLLENVLRRAQALNLLCLIGTGDALENATPYYAWRPVFRMLLGIDRFEQVTDRHQHLLAQWADQPELLARAPLLNPITGLNFPDNDFTIQLTGKVRADNIRALLIEILSAQLAKRAGVLLVLDDAHWLDSASWGLVGAISQQVATVLLVIAMRPLTAPPSEEYTQLCNLPSTQLIQLNAMPASEITKLICQRLGVATLPKEVDELLRSKAEGHPFFSEELVYALRDAGLLRIVDGQCQLTVAADVWQTLEFPNTIQAAITSRIDRLPPSEQLLLKVASVIGHFFGFQTLHDVYPVKQEQLQISTYLDQLTNLEITLLTAPEPNLAYRFRHIIAQEATYNLLLFAQRQELHRAVAAWYEYKYSDDLSPYYSILAYHWGQAQDTTKTLYYLEMAGKQALRNYANREAVTFFTQALDLLIQKPGEGQVVPVQQAGWERQLGEAYIGLGQFVQSRDHLQRALVLLDKAPSANRILFSGQTAWYALRPILHHSWVQRWLPRSQGENTVLLETIQTLDSLSTISYYTGEILTAIHATLYAVNLVESLTLTNESAYAVVRTYGNAVGVFGAILKRHALAEEYLQSAQKIAQLGDQPIALGWALQVYGVYKLNAGAWQVAIDYFIQTKEIFARYGVWRHLQESTHFLAVGYYLQGDWAESKSLSQEVYDLARRYKDQQFQIFGLCGQALIQLAQNELDAAIILLKEGLSLLGDSSLYLEQLSCQGLLAWAYLSKGEEQTARQIAAQGIALVAKAPTSNLALYGYASLAEVFLALWESSKGAMPAEEKRLAQWVDQAWRALDRSARQIVHFYNPQALRLKGCYLWLDHQPAKAHKRWRQSLSEAERLQIPYEQARAHFEIGRHLPSTDPTRQQHLSQAHKLFVQLGASHDLARLEKLRENAEENKVSL